MNMSGLVNSITRSGHRLSLTGGLINQSTRPISTTNVLFAEPPRKKRRIDPAILRVRVEKKIKKLEREIARIESEPRQLVPIPEYQLSKSNIRDFSARPGRQLEEFGLTQGNIKAASRLWSIYRLEQAKMQQYSIKRVEAAQSHALQTLKEVDESLYNKTVEADELSGLPYYSSHIRKEYPGALDYQPPDGFITDKTAPKIMAAPPSTATTRAKR